MDQLSALPWVFVAVVVGYVGVRFVGALRSGAPLGKAVGRALLESVPSAGMLLLGVICLGVGTGLWAMAGAFREMGEALPFLMPFLMLVFVALYPMAVGLVVAGVMMLLGGGATVTGFFAARRMGKRRTRQPLAATTAPPPAPAPPMPSAPPPPPPPTVEATTARPARPRRAPANRPASRRERPLRAPGR